MVQMIDGGIIVQSRDNVDQAKEHNHPVHANGISKNRTSSVVAGEPDVADDKRVSGTMHIRLIPRQILKTPAVILCFEGLIYLKFR